MASISANGSKGHHKFTLNVTENSTSISDNTSYLSFSFKLSPIQTSWNWADWGTKIYYSININGSVYSGYIPNYDGYSTVTLNSGSLSVGHNSDGTKAIDISFSVTDKANQRYTSGNASSSGSMTLTTIPRASSVSGGSGNIGGTTTINISRASSSFTHTLEYAFGSLTGTIATGVGTSYTWTIPTSFYSQIPSSNSGTGTITCKTYNGSTLIGTSTCSFNASVTNSNPTVGTFTYKDSNSVTTAISENNQRIIRNNSNLLFTIGTATPKNSSSISKYEITFNNITKSRTSAGDLDFGTINLSSNSTARLKVTDSRGNTATKDITIIIDDWVLPTALISLNRKNNFYSETYLKVDASYSSLNGKNSIGIQYQYKKLSDKNFSAFYNLDNNVQTTIDLDNNYQWNISVVITDRIGETTYNLVLDRGMPIILFDRIKNSVGINCFPNENKSLEINGQLLVSGNGIVNLDIGETVNYLNSTIGGLIDRTITSGSNSNGSWIKFYDGTMICTMSIEVTDQGVTNAYGSLFQGTRIWVYPVAFSNVPTVSCDMWQCASGASWGTVAEKYSTQCTLRGFDVVSRAVGTITKISATAIGRWK